MVRIWHHISLLILPGQLRDRIPQEALADPTSSDFFSEMPDYLVYLPFLILPVMLYPVVTVTSPS